MRFAVITDIHGNREALDAVLSRLADIDHDGLICLGDIVGYGADPGYCVDRIAGLVASGAVALRGNHDDAIRHGTSGMNHVAAAALEWTRDHLSADQRGFLADLPLTHAAGDVLFVHADPSSPADWNYVFDESDAAASFAASKASVTLCGHTHRPALFRFGERRRTERLAIEQGVEQPLDPHARWIAVIGSVGQPRDGNPDAAFGILDTGRRTLRFERERYNVQLAATKIAAAGLPLMLADRLSEGR